jgi:uncharacterized protein
MRKLAVLLIPVVSFLLFSSCAEDQPQATVQVLSSVGEVSQMDSGKKRVLAILGDGWHRVAPLDQALVSGLRKEGWEAIVIMDYNVPWDDFADYDLIIMSREGHEFIQYYRTRDTEPQPEKRPYWLTPDQEMKFVEYVNAGGRLFLYHDGFGNYECGNGVSQVARSCFVRHPPIVDINVTTTGNMPELTEGITPFVVADEEYVVDMDENQTSVFLESHSPENGRAPQGWAHTFGDGKVAVLIPGHKMDTITHPMIGNLIENILDWLVG